MEKMAKPRVEWYWDKKVSDGKGGYIIKQEKFHESEYEEDGVKKQPDIWDLGTIKAGNKATSDSTIQRFYIWNNKGIDSIERGGKCQRMTQCHLTIRDGESDDGQYHEGNAQSPIVTKRWIKARYYKTNPNASGEKDDPYEVDQGWVEVGLGDDLKMASMDFEAIGTRGKDSEGTANGTTDVFEAQQIAGELNDGLIDTDISRNNYAMIDLKMVVPDKAEAGRVNFIVRIYYGSRVI